MKNTIYGLAVLALSSGEPVGKFAVPQESSGTPLSSHQDCQPGHCVEPDVRKIGPLHVDTACSTLYQHTIYRRPGVIAYSKTIVSGFSR